MVSIALPQKSCGNKIRCPQSLPGPAPLTKKPEDSGYEIVSYGALHTHQRHMRSSAIILVLQKKIGVTMDFFRDNIASIKKKAIHCFVFYCF